MKPPKDFCGRRLRGASWSCGSRWPPRSPAPDCRSSWRGRTWRRAPRAARLPPSTPGAVTWPRLVRMRAAGAKCRMQQTASRVAMEAFPDGGPCAAWLRAIYIYIYIYIIHGSRGMDSVPRAGDARRRCSGGTWRAARTRARPGRPRTRRRSVAGRGARPSSRVRPGGLQGAQRCSQESSANAVTNTRSPALPGISAPI